MNTAAKTQFRFFPNVRIVLLYQAELQRIFNRREDRRRDSSFWTLHHKTEQHPAQSNNFATYGFLHETRKATMQFLNNIFRGKATEPSKPVKEKALRRSRKSKRPPSEADTASSVSSRHFHQDTRSAN